MQFASNYFQYFQNKDLNHNNLGGHPLWIVEATNYMNLLVKFKELRLDNNNALIDTWLIKYTKFLDQKKLQQKSIPLKTCFLTERRIRKNHKKDSPPYFFFKHFFFGFFLH